MVPSGPIVGVTPEQAQIGLRPDLLPGTNKPIDGRDTGVIPTKGMKWKSLAGSTPDNGKPIKTIADLLHVGDVVYVSAADGAPTSNLPEIFGILTTELARYTAELDRVWATDLVAVNKELARLKLPPLDPKCEKTEGCVVTP